MRKRNQPVLVRRLDEEIDNSPVRVSYIIATRNGEAHLRRTLANLREFLGEEDELIIIDGGSSDSTADAVADNHDIVDVFVSEPDSSEAHAFNKGLTLARGRLIKPLSDDDYFYPQEIQSLVAIAESHPAIDAILTGGEEWVIENDQPRFICFRRLPDEFSNPTPEQIFEWCVGPGLLIRRRAVLKIGGCSPGYVSVDGDCCCKLIEANCVVRYLDTNLYRWYCHRHSASSNSDGMELSTLMFKLRLRDLGGYYGGAPRVTARITGMDRQPGGLGFQYVVFLSQRIWRSRARFLLRIAPPLVDAMQLGLRGVRRLISNTNAASVSNDRLVDPQSCSSFNGKLR
jgi:glycosyltransferase involved in cell wall biosynthesis